MILHLFHPLMLQHAMAKDSVTFLSCIIQKLWLKMVLHLCPLYYNKLRLNNCYIFVLLRHTKDGVISSSSMLQQATAKDGVTSLSSMLQQIIAKDGLTSSSGR